MFRNIINCTPHPIMVRSKETGGLVEFKASGVLPRVTTNEEFMGLIADGRGVFECVRQTQGAVEGLPDPQPDTLLIVSALVFGASDRPDLIAPDTGKGAIRDDKGRIQAVTRFICK